MISTPATIPAVIPAGISSQTIVSFDPDALRESFLKYVDRKPTTMKGYDNALKRFARWMDENGIRTPSRDDLIAYRSYLEESDLEPSSQAQYLQAVRMFFKWTSLEGIYPNIADNLHGPKIRRDVHRKDAFSREAINRIRDGIDTSTETGKRLDAIILLQVIGGLRCCEISRANVCDMKEENGIWYLWIQGKGHDQKDAAIELIPEVKEVIDDYLESRSAPLAPKSPLFTSTSNINKGGRIAPSTVSMYIKEAFKNAGYDSDRLTAHSLRHTSATAVFKATGDIYLTSKHQRHADISTTEIYVHAMEREERHSERAAYDYLFGEDSDQDSRNELISMISGMDADSVQMLLDYAKAM